MTITHNQAAENFVQGKSKDFMEIVKIIGPLIEKTSHEIFAAFGSELLKKPNTYFLSAVWSRKNDHPLTATQKKMRAIINPVVDDIVEMMGLDGLDGSQAFALEYLIRGLFISKITYMIEAVKNRGGKSKSPSSHNQAQDTLYWTEVIGNA